tara:strand:- start:4590 stop:5090 length:501 start_codon:yes stop_codon:yes gene_type:complete
MKFFLNPRNHSYLRELASEFGESTNGVRVELNRLMEVGLLSTKSSGRTIQYSANTNHALYGEIRSLVKKYMGVDQIIDKLVKKLGHVQSAFIIGDYARGKDTGLIDIILIGKINKIELNNIAEKRGKEISKKIRPMVLTKIELRSLWKQLDMDNALLIWGSPVEKN